MKKMARTMAAADRAYSYGTGGGSYKPPVFEDRELLEEIRAMIPLSTDGLPPRSGSDCNGKPIKTIVEDGKGLLSMVGVEVNMSMTN
jgi:hypothetical protein